MKTYYANIKDAKLLNTLMGRLAKEEPTGRCIEITVNLNDCKKTVNNHPYYKACVAHIAKNLGLHKEEADSLIKYKFLRKSVEINGETEFIINTSIYKKEFNRLIVEMKVWAERIGIKLPEQEGESIFDFNP